MWSGKLMTMAQSLADQVVAHEAGPLTGDALKPE
jgi:hypothetical protein